jgi:hypothetical protein
MSVASTGPMIRNVTAAGAKAGEQATTAQTSLPIVIFGISSTPGAATDEPRPACNADDPRHRDCERVPGFRLPERAPKWTRGAINFVAIIPVYFAMSTVNLDFQLEIFLVNHSTPLTMHNQTS